MTEIRTAAVTVMGLGFMRPASGTWGSTPPPALAWLLLVASAPVWIVNSAMVVVDVVFAVACAYDFARALALVWHGGHHRRHATPPSGTRP